MYSLTEVRVLGYDMLLIITVKSYSWNSFK